MWDFFQATLLGVIQGFTEFLPVSSSAHLILASHFLRGKELPLSLNVGLHTGTLLAVLVYFRAEWINYFREFSAKEAFKKDSPFEKKALLLFCVGTLPAGIAGFFLKDAIELYLHHPLVTLPPLIVVGFILVWADRHFPSDKDLQSIHLREIFILGLFQALALVPGVSRSGATLTAARGLGISRTSAAKVSFLLGCPVMLAAALMEFKHVGPAVFDSFFMVAFLTAFLSGVLVIKFFLDFLKRFGFLIFAIYRLLLGLILGYLLLRGS